MNSIIIDRNALQQHWAPMLGRVGLALVLLATTAAGQQGLWESLIEQGNQALAAGNPHEARNHYSRAWEVAAQYPVHDLRRATTQRNLAQARMLLGDLAPADSLYDRAIICAERTLEQQHSYLVTLRHEQENLRAAIAASLDFHEERLPPPTVWEALVLRVRWITDHTIVRPGISRPLGDSLSITHDRGLGMSATLQFRLMELGALPIIAGLDHFELQLPAKHADHRPVRLRGNGVFLGPSLGRFLLTMGAGQYSLSGGLADPSRIGLNGALTVSILGRPGDSSSIGTQVALRIGGLHLLAAGDQETFTLWQLGFSIGFRRPPPW
ncbi:MAG: tetratricopeptide repeat protein [Candidatus Marinimicrobia bacterium]|nr:tetratricopeptide repeat protein [Candidatus Neomarinimicrobiota bacterium]